MLNSNIFHNKFTHKFARLSTLLFKIIFVNPRTYIFVFLLSALVASLTSWLWNNYSFYQILPPILLNFLAVPVLFASFYLGIFIIEWRAKNFLKRIKIIDINEYYLILVLFCLNVVLVTIAFLFNIICYNLYSLIPFFNFHLPLLSNIRWFIWIYFLLAMILLTFFLTMITIFITTFFTKRHLSFAFLVVTMLFLLLFSDILIQPTLTNNKMLFIVGGYLCPLKYFIWFNMLITSYQFLDPLGMTQIIQDNNSSFIVFQQLWQPVVGMAFFTVIISFLTKRHFKWSLKS